jgi:hypothetical protein
MKKIDLGQTLTILANIGVIAGIVLLAVELRQNDETQRLLAVQQVLGLAFTNGIVVSTDEGLSEALVTANAGGQLSAVQRNQIDTFIRAVMNGMWQVYFQYEHGFLEPDFWEAFVRRTRESMAIPLFREWWQRNKRAFSVDFQNYVDDQMQDVDAE